MDVYSQFRSVIDDVRPLPAPKVTAVMTAARGMPTDTYDHPIMASILPGVHVSPYVRVWVWVAHALPELTWAPPCIVKTALLLGTEMAMPLGLVLHCLT